MQNFVLTSDRWKDLWLVPAVLLGALAAYNPLVSLVALVVLLAILMAVEKFETCLMLLVFYFPFQVALNLAPGMDVASGRALILALLAVWVARSLKNRQLVFNFSPQTLLLLLFLLLAILSVFSAGETDRALRKLLVLFSVLPLYFLLTAYAANSKMLWQTLRALFLSLLLLSLVALGQFFSQFLFGLDVVLLFWQTRVAPLFLGETFAVAVIDNPSWLVNLGGRTVMRAFAILPDPHIFAFYVGMIIPLLFALSQFSLPTLNQKSRWFRRDALVLILVLALTAELFTFSRGGYVGLVCALGVMLALLLPRFSTEQKIFWFIVTSVLGSLFLFLGGPVLMRFWSIFNLMEGSNAARFLNWRQGWEIFSDHWMLGTGLGNYAYVLNPALSYRDPVYAHNLYLDLGAEMGIAALGVYVLLITVTVWQLWLTFRRTTEKSLSLLALGLIGSWVWFSAHAFFDTPFFSPQILGVWTVMLALSVLVIQQSKTKLKTSL